MSKMKKKHGSLRWTYL